MQRHHSDGIGAAFAFFIVPRLRKVSLSNTQPIEMWIVYPGGSAEWQAIVRSGECSSGNPGLQFFRLMGKQPNKSSVPYGDGSF